MMEEVSQFLQLILSALVTAVVPVLIGYVITWLKAQRQELEANLGDRERYIIHEALRVAVLAAEQSGLADELLRAGDAKKDFAINVAEQYLARYNITLNLDELADLIEAAVYDEINRDKDEPVHTCHVRPAP